MNIDWASPEPSCGLSSELDKIVKLGQAHPQGEKQ
jgi:hypothetical protein